MSNAVAVTPKQFFDKPLVQEKLKELVGKNAASFATSVLQIVNSNDMLKSADPQTIFSAACMAATLNLPINNGLGFAYIVPFKNNKAGRIEAQFQMGYKGFIQLAQRSGQFERIAAVPVYAGQIVKADPLLGYEWDWSVKPTANQQPVGYVAFFKLINGFTAELYMTVDEIKAHANKYSQTYKKGFGVWKDQFDAMALKTVLKLLLSKQAPLSIEMQQAQIADQAVVRDIDVGEFDYIDHQDTDGEIEAPKLEVPDSEMPALIAQVQAGALELDYIESNYSLTPEQQKRIAEVVPVVA